MSTLDSLRARLLGDFSPFPLDALKYAIEVAAFELDARRGDSRYTRQELAIRIGDALPDSATDLERGLAIGLTLALQTEPVIEVTEATVTRAVDAYDVARCQRLALSPDHGMTVNQKRTIRPMIEAAIRVAVNPEPRT